MVAGDSSGARVGGDGGGANAGSADGGVGVGSVCKSTQSLSDEGLADGGAGSCGGGTTLTIGCVAVTNSALIG